MPTKTDQRKRSNRAALILMTAISLSWAISTLMANASSADDLATRLLALAIVLGVNFVMALEYGFLRRIDAMAILASGSHDNKRLQELNSRSKAASGGIVLSYLLVGWAVATSIVRETNPDYYMIFHLDVAGAILTYVIARFASAVHHSRHN